MSRTAFTVSPVDVVVALRVSMTTSWDSKGRPRQLRLIAENSRCSILFHLEVPGGRWQTVMSSPASVAKAASSVFHNRSRVPIRMLRTPDAPWRSARRPATTATPARPNAGGSTTNGQRPDRSPQQAASYHKCGQTKQKNLNNYCAPPKRTKPRWRRLCNWNPSLQGAVGGIGRPPYKRCGPDI